MYGWCLCIWGKKGVRGGEYLCFIIYYLITKQGWVNWSNWNAQFVSFILKWWRSTTNFNMKIYLFSNKHEVNNYFCVKMRWAMLLMKMCLKIFKLLQCFNCCDWLMCFNHCTQNIHQDLKSIINCCTGEKSFPYLCKELPIALFKIN